MRINFVTGHAAVQKRKTGFHFWSDYLSSQGHEVRWITTGFSCLSFLKKDKAQHLPKGPFNTWVDIKPGVRSLLWRPLFHPVNLRALNTALAPLFQLYPKMMPGSMLEMIKGSDVFIVDSGAALMLVPDFRKTCPKARIIYFSSDRMNTLSAHSSVVAAEKNALPYIDLIRVVSEECIDDFAGHEKVRYIPQGIDKESFDRETVNPYTASKNIVCAGDMLFDAQAVEAMAALFPDVQFHLFGKKARVDKPMPNITEYGEYDFDAMIPYLKYADIGLAPYGPAEGGTYFAQSGLKIAQYTYCRLPNVLPNTVSNRLPHHIAYDRGDTNSIRNAIESAFNYKRDTIDRCSIPGWNDVIVQILVEAGAITK